MRRLLRVLSFCLLAGCSTLPIDTTYTSIGQDSRVRFLVIHYTQADFDRALRLLTEGEVSSHYLVRDDPPTVYRLVSEERRAYHAGVSSWRGDTYLNASSIGIEIVNRGPEGDLLTGNWQAFPKAQIDVVVALVRDIVKRHGIRPERIVGHSDIAPQRKVDPGPRFPWKRLAEEGLIAWPDERTVAARRGAYEATLPDIAWFQQMLTKHGFAVPSHGELDLATRNVLRAFQMKYRPARFDGEPDAETAAMLDALVNP